MKGGRCSLPFDVSYLLPITSAYLYFVLCSAHSPLLLREAFPFWYVYVPYLKIEGNQCVVCRSRHLIANCVTRAPRPRPPA
jgi:hypothetical protein